MPIGIPFSGGKPRLNKVKASGGCHRFSEEIYQAKLDKIWVHIRQGTYDYPSNLYSLDHRAAGSCICTEGEKKNEVKRQPA